MDFPIIPQLDEHAIQQARQRQSTLLKPQGALGRLEALSIHLAGMTGRLDWRPHQPAALIFAGDHGINAHGVSAVPSTVTALMVGQFLRGGAAVNALARQMGAQLVIVDAGVQSPIDPPEALPDSIRFIGANIAAGTADFSAQWAMTSAQAEQSLQLGMDTARALIREGVDLLALGEMGIGNTTSASAVIAALTGAPLAQVTGYGTGIDEARYQRKRDLIDTALALHAPVQAHPLEKVGGFEIGALAGAMIGAAAKRCPVLVDGFICTAAALIAQHYQPDVTRFLIGAHRSAEPGHLVALNALGLEPLLDLQMRLGEATGALLAIPLIEAAMRTLQEMATFDVLGLA